MQVAGATESGANKRFAEKSQKQLLIGTNQYFFPINMLFQVLEVVFYLITTE